MPNDLEISSCWTPFLTKNDSSVTFDRFLTVLQEFDNNNLPDTWFKWKNFTNQVVVETPNYFFKLYEDCYNTGCFFYEIRKNLADIYKEKFGILWEVRRIDEGGKVYTFEKRQKLTLCTLNSISYANLLLNWSYTLQELEKRLLLPEICEQLKPYISGLAEIKLIRDCINKYIDYAITEAGDVILLDDADWFLALVDKNGKWLSSRHRGYNILSSLGESIFAPLHYFDEESVCSSDELENKWQIYMENESMDRLDGKLKDWRESMLTENIRLIAKQELLPSTNITYFEPKQEQLKIDHE